MEATVEDEHLNECKIVRSTMMNYDDNIAGVEDKHSVQRHNKTARRHQAQRPHVPAGDYHINISTTPIIISSMCLQVVTAHIISESQANSLLRAGHSHTKKTRWILL